MRADAVAPCDLSVTDLSAAEHLAALHLEKAIVEPPLKARPAPRSFELHPAIFRLMGACYAWFLGMMAVAFGDGEGMSIVLVACLVYGAMYFGVPVVLERMKSGDIKRRLSWAAFMQRGIRTASGHMSGGAVVGQVLVVPACIAFFATVVVIIRSIVF